MISLEYSALPSHHGTSNDTECFSRVAYRCPPEQCRTVCFSCWRVQIFSLVLSLACRLSQHERGGLSGPVVSILPYAVHNGCGSSMAFYESAAPVQIQVRLVHSSWLMHDEKSLRCFSPSFQIEKNDIRTRPPRPSLSL